MYLRKTQEKWTWISPNDKTRNKMITSSQPKSIL